MKKLFLMLILALFSLTTHAAPAIPENAIDIDGLTQFSLNKYSANTLRIYGHTSGAASAGICRIIIRSKNGLYNGGFKQLADRFTFKRTFFPADNEPVTPIITAYALMFQLHKTDYGFENILMESKDGKSIGENIKEVFKGQNQGEVPIAVIAGTCY